MNSTRETRSTPQPSTAKKVPSTRKGVTELFGAPPPARTGRDRIIATATELFYRHGYQAVGLDWILREAAITKTTFYKRFESKDDLVLACIQTSDQWESSAWSRAVKKLGGDDPRNQLIAFFEVLDLWFNDPEFRGCIFVNAASEFTDRRDPIHQAAAAHKRRTRDQFRMLAAAAGATEPDTFADQYMILMEGTLSLRHVHDRNDAAKVARPAVMELIDRYIPTNDKPAKLKPSRQSHKTPAGT